MKGGWAIPIGILIVLSFPPVGLSLSWPPYQDISSLQPVALDTLILNLAAFTALRSRDYRHDDWRRLGDVERIPHRRNRYLGR